MLSHSYPRAVRLNSTVLPYNIHPVEFPAQVRMPEGKAADFCAFRARVSLRGTSADRGGATPGLRSLQSLDRATHASAPSELSLLTASGSLPSSYQNQEKSVNRPWQSLPHSSTRVRGNPPPPQLNKSPRPIQPRRASSAAHRKRQAIEANLLSYGFRS